jgi:hypothetical protein
MLDVFLSLRLAAQDPLAGEGEEARMRRRRKREDSNKHPRKPSQRP